MYASIINNYIRQFRVVIYVKNQPLMNAFGEKTKELRLVNKLSQQTLANIAGIEVSQIGRIERGEINVSLSTMDLIATALGVLPSQMLGQIGH